MMSALLRRSVLVLVVAMVSAGLIAGAWGDAATALAVLCGGAVAVINAVLLWWRYRQGARDVHSDAARHLRSFYRSGLERFLVVCILLAAGLALTGLAPLPLLAGFVVGQLVWILATLALRERT
jgi:ATP synthase protein I